MSSLASKFELNQLALAGLIQPRCKVKLQFYPQELSDFKQLVTVINDSSLVVSKTGVRLLHVC